MALPMSKRTRVAIDESKLRRVQQLLDARTAADAVDKALDQVLFGEEVMATLVPSPVREKDYRRLWQSPLTFSLIPIFTCACFTPKPTNAITENVFPALPRYISLFSYSS